MMAMIVSVITSAMLIAPSKPKMENAPPMIVPVNRQRRRLAFQTPHLDTIISQPFVVKRSLTLKGAEKSMTSRGLTNVRS